MTNGYITITEPLGTMPNEVLKLADQLAAKSLWELLLWFILLWITASGWAVWFMSKKREEFNERLIKAEESRAQIIRELSHEKELLAAEYSRRLEEIVKQQVESQHRLVMALESIERTLEAGLKGTP